MSEPFAMVPRSWLPRLAKLNKTQILVLLALVLQGRNGRKTRRAELEVTGASPRHIQLALAQLERQGLISVHRQCHQNDRWGQFEVRFHVSSPVRSQGSHCEAGGAAPSAIPGIAVPRSPGSHYSSRSDQIINPPFPPPQPAPVIPLRDTPGRQGWREDDFAQLVKEAQRLFPAASTKAARRWLCRLLDAAGDVSARIVVSYLRHCAEDPSIVHPRTQYPLAVACTADRWNDWARREQARATALARHQAELRAELAAEASDDGARIDAADVEEFAQRFARGEF